MTSDLKLIKYFEQYEKVTFISPLFWAINIL